MWTTNKENIHLHEFKVGGTVQGSITVNRDSFEYTVNGNTKSLSGSEKLHEVKAYVERIYAKQY